MKTLLNSISKKLFLSLLAALGTASAALAQGEAATGTVSGVPDGGSYDYTITLNNTSSTVPIGSFWYSWTPNIPPYFYLPGVPTSAAAPTGWASGIAANSIQFVANTPADALAPGQSMQFTYVATFSPAQLTGLTGYSYVYSGGLELDSGAFVNIQTVPAPEPSSMGLLVTGVIGLWVASRRLQKASTMRAARLPIASALREL